LKIENLFEVLVEILKNVGDFLLENKSKGSITGQWIGAQYKTDTDLAAQKIIINELRKLSLKIPIISEEDSSSHSNRRPKQYWLIDPIDGTASYCEGFSGYVSQIALMQDMRPVIAAVYAPVVNKLYLAEYGSGATLNGNKLISKGKGLDKIVLVDNYPKPTGIAENVFKNLNCNSYVESGSIGLKICLIAENKANLFVKDVVFRDWDVAPGDLILNEAGGGIFDLNGKEITYNANIEKFQGLIATSNRDLVKRVVNLYQTTKN